MKSNLNRIAEKVAAHTIYKDLEDGPYRVTDMIRATVQVENGPEMQQAYDIVKKTIGMLDLLKITNEIMTPYHRVIINF